MMDDYLFETHEQVIAYALTHGVSLQAACKVVCSVSSLLGELYHYTKEILEHELETGVYSDAPELTASVTALVRRDDQC